MPRPASRGQEISHWQAIPHAYSHGAQKHEKIKRLMLFPINHYSENQQCRKRSTGSSHASRIGAYEAAPSPTIQYFRLTSTRYAPDSTLATTHTTHMYTSHEKNSTGIPTASTFVFSPRIVCIHSIRYAKRNFKTSNIHPAVCAV